VVLLSEGRRGLGHHYVDVFRAEKR
jgi:hypothetical protein